MKYIKYGLGFMLRIYNRNEMQSILLVTLHQGVTTWSTWCNQFNEMQYSQLERVLQSLFLFFLTDCQRSVAWSRLWANVQFRGFSIYLSVSKVHETNLLGVWFSSNENEQKIVYGGKRCNSQFSLSWSYAGWSIWWTKSQSCKKPFNILSQIALGNHSRRSLS